MKIMMLTHIISLPIFFNKMSCAVVTEKFIPLNSAEEIKIYEEIYSDLENWLEKGKLSVKYEFLEVHSSPVTDVYLVKSKNKSYCLKAHSKRTSFLNEALILNRLHHDNIIRAYSTRNSVANNRYSVILMEYLSIGINFTAINQCEEWIINILYDTLKGVYFLHGNDIIHGDIKPANVLGLRIPDGVVYKIIDFDSSKKLNPGQTQTKLMRGTALYMPKEVFYDSNLSFKADIYGIGTLGYFLLYDINNEKEYLENLEAFKCKIHPNKPASTLNKKCIKECHVSTMCDSCKKCKKCKLCISCDVCKTCTNCKKCKICPICKRKEQIEYNEYQYYTIHKKVIPTSNPKLKSFLLNCLQDFNKRPDAIQLLKNNDTKELFKEHWNDADFPGLVK